MPAKDFTLFLYVISVILKCGKLEIRLYKNIQMIGFVLFEQIQTLKCFFFALRISLYSNRFKALSQAMNE